MVIAGWFAVAVAVWLLDSAVRNRPPIQTLRELVISGTLPTTGKSYPGPAHTGAPGTAGAAAGTGAAGATGASSNTSGAPVSGDVNSWITQANAILVASGVPASQLDVASQQMIIHYESGGDPTIVNTTDSNARAGHPSIGLGQTIKSTFDTYALPGHTTITNPVDNIIAFTRYAIDKYGNLANVPGVKAVRAGGSYTGY